MFPVAGVAIEPHISRNTDRFFGQSNGVLLGMGFDTSTTISKHADRSWLPKTCHEIPRANHEET